MFDKVHVYRCWIFNNINLFLGFRLPNSFCYLLDTQRGMLQFKSINVVKNVDYLPSPVLDDDCITHDVEIENRNSFFNAMKIKFQIELNYV